MTQLSIKDEIGELPHFIRTAKDPVKGVGVRISCGSFVEFRLEIDDLGVIISVEISSDGCGSMLNSSERAAAFLEGLRVRDIGGVYQILSADDSECSEAIKTAISSALSAHRKKTVEEFKGETALVCSCFGVGEETIEKIAANLADPTIDEIGRECNAGTGCGSCRMIIQEILDSADINSV